MDGQGNIEVNAPKNMSITVGENLDISVGKNMTTNVGQTISETAGEDIVQSAAGNITESADNKTEIVDKNYIKQAKEINETAGQITAISTNGNMVIQSAKIVELNSGEKSNLF